MILTGDIAQGDYLVRIEYKISVFKKRIGMRRRHNASDDAGSAVGSEQHGNG
jgi:hypothetical protein